jgi:arabinan endo-1,5-alpha-L-arabinosidase
MMKKLFAAFSALLFLLPVAGCSGNSPSGKDDTYTNPVYAPVFADPAVIEHEGKYYAYGTEDYGEWKPSDDPLENESNLKCVPILQSSDMVTWYYAGAAFRGSKKPSWGSPGANVWAPDVVKIGDQFVMYYSLSIWGDPDPGIGIATAENPVGPWTDHGKLFTSLEIGVDNSIDPAVFRGDDGKLYMIWGSFRGLFGVELTDDGMGLKNGLDYAKENKVLVAGVVGPWNGATYEGAYVVRKDGYYYLFVSSGTCCDGFNSSYHVRVGRSQNPLGPYTDDNGNSMCGERRGHLVVQGNSEFVGVGHNSVVRDEAGDYYIYYHGFDATLSSPMYGNSNRRSLLVDKLEWTESGWPQVKDQVAGRSGMKAPVVKSEK